MNNSEFHTVRGYQMLNIEEKLLTPSMEDYLEMIYRIYNNEKHARINQLAKELNVKPASVSKTIKKLAALKLINYQKYGTIMLLDEGKEIGKFLLNRHQIIEEFLINIGNSNTLLKDIEMIEHDIGIYTLSNMYSLNKFFKLNKDIKKKYNYFRDNLNSLD